MTKTFFETYQTFITGLVGFAGVIITMIVNARNQRKLHTRQTEHEARSLRVALKSELLANKRTYENRIQDFNAPQDHSHALIQNKAVDEVYKTLLNNIGLLSEEEIEKIFKAYLLIEELPYRLRILVGTDSIGGHNDEFLRLKEEYFSVAAEIHKSFLKDIEKAIDSINIKLSQQGAK